MKILRSVKVTLDPYEVSRIVREYLAKEGFEVHDVEFEVGSHLEGFCQDEYEVHTFDGCIAKCRVTTEREET
jgi:hypothetical protein